MLGALLPRWGGKLAILALLGFAATDFMITMTLSAADATAHFVENPLIPKSFGSHTILITLILLALLAAVFLRGFTEAIKVAGNLQSHLSSNVNNIAQRAALAALTGPQTEAEQMRQAFDRRRKVIVAELSKIPGVEVPNPLGAFYVYPDVRGLLGREWQGTRVDTSLELADLILDKAEVAVVPGEAFGPSGYLRLSYALGDDQLLEGVQRLQALFG